MGHRRYRRRQGLCFPHPQGRDLYSCNRDHHAFQVPAAPAGKVARSERPGYPLSSALSGSDRKPERQADFRYQKSDCPGDPCVSGRHRLSGSRDTGSAAPADRCGCKTVCHTSQHAGHGYVPAHRNRTESEKADRRRFRPCVRSGTHFPERGHGSVAQPGIHHHRNVPGIHRLSRHDGSDRGYVPHTGKEDLRQGYYFLPGYRHSSGRTVGASDHGRGCQEVCRRRLQRLGNGC